MNKKSFNDQIQKLILLLYRLRGMILYLYCIIIQNQFPYHNLLGYQGSLWVHLLVQLFKCCVILHHFLFDITIITLLQIYIFLSQIFKILQKFEFCNSEQLKNLGRISLSAWIQTNRHPNKQNIFIDLCKL